MFNSRTLAVAIKFHTKITICLWKKLKTRIFGFCAHFNPKKSPRKTENIFFACSHSRTIRNGKILNFQTKRAICLGEQLKPWFLDFSALFDPKRTTERSTSRKLSRPPICIIKFKKLKKVSTVPVPTLERIKIKKKTVEMQSKSDKKVWILEQFF